MLVPNQYKMFGKPIQQSQIIKQYSLGKNRAIAVLHTGQVVLFIYYKDGKKKLRRNEFIIPKECKEKFFEAVCEIFVKTI